MVRTITVPTTTVSRRRSGRAEAAAAPGPPEPGGRYAPAVEYEAELIIQLPRGSSIEENLRAEPPASVGDSRVVVEPLDPGADGDLLPPRAGEIILTVPSPEALRREPAELRRVVTEAAADGDPLVVLVEGAEYLRDDELDAILSAAAETKRLLILRILSGL
jgi:hypothetical protein